MRVELHAGSVNRLIEPACNYKRMLSLNAVHLNELLVEWTQLILVQLVEFSYSQAQIITTKLLIFRLSLAFYHFATFGTMFEN